MGLRGELRAVVDAGLEGLGVGRSLLLLLLLLLLELLTRMLGQ